VLDTLHGSAADDPEHYALSTWKDTSAVGAVAMLQDSTTKTGCVPRTFRLNGAK